MGFFAFEAEEAVGAEGLHQTLCGGEQEKFTEGIPIVRGAGNLVIIEKEILTPCFWKGDVGIAEERCEVVEGASGAQPLKIDQDRFAVADHHVLRLKIAVDENKRRCEQPTGQLRKFRLQGFILCGREVNLADVPDAVLPEVVPLPPVEIRIEAGHQAESGGKAIRRKRDHFRGLCESFFVEIVANLPRGVAECVEIPVSQILHED